MEIARYAIVRAVVVSHQPYGLIIRLASGKRGFVDSDYVAMPYVPPDRWPAIGQEVVGVVLGVTDDQRVRLSLRPHEVELARSVVDVREALGTWGRISSGEVDDDERLQLIRTRDGLSVLRWALGEHEDSATFQDAIRVLSVAPADVIADLAPELYQRADLVEVRRILEMLST